MISQEVKVALQRRLCLYVKCILADLVGILARSRYFDASTPVEVEVAKLVCQILQHSTVQVGRVIAHEEVSRQNAPLSCRLTDQEEVVKASLLIANDIAVDYGATRWVLDWKIRRLDLGIGDALLEKSLVNTLIYNH